MIASLIERIRVAVDAPRFCADCGRAIKVDNSPDFDERTGKAIDHWYWHCPETTVTFSSYSTRASSSGYYVHRWGNGRPRWHREDER